MLREYWQGASVAGKVPNLEEVLGRSMRGLLTIYITYIFVSIRTPLAVAGPHWQLAYYITRKMVARLTLFFRQRSVLLCIIAIVADLTCSVHSHKEIIVYM